MSQDQLIGRQRVKYDNFLEAYGERKICPFCGSTCLFLFTNNSLRKCHQTKEYPIIIKNHDGTDDYIRIGNNGKSIEIFSTTVGFKGYLNLPLSLKCTNCFSYTCLFRLVINIKTNVIDKVLLTAITLSSKMDDEMVIIQSVYPMSDVPHSKIYVGSNTYKIDLIDMDLSKLNEMFEKYFNILPFI